MTRHSTHAAVFAVLLLAAAVLAALVTRDAPAPTPVARGHPASGIGARHHAVAEVREQRARGEQDKGDEADRERRRADAGAASEAVHGPATEAVDARAYPRTYVGARQAAVARTAYVTAPARLTAADFRRGADVQPSLSSTWQSVGPTDPLVPGDVTFTGAAATNAGRVTAMAVDPHCSIAATCRMWIAAAGGGIWRTNDALAPQPTWQAVDNGLTTSAFGSLVVDPSDPSGDTLYAGSGEANGSGDSEAGVGLFRSTDGGDSWGLVPGSAAVATDRAIGSIAISPDGSTIWIGTGLARHGSAAVNGGRVTPPNAPTLGLYESTDGGATFSLAFSRPASGTDPAGGTDWFQGGVNHVQLDPNHPAIVYAAVAGYGIWRNSADGATATPGFSQVFATMAPAGYANADTYGDRTEFALADLGSSSRMYVGDSSEDGNAGTGRALLWRTDDVNVPAASMVNAGGAPPGGAIPANASGAWIQLSSTNRSQPGYTSYRYCHEQCGYNNVVAADPSNPNTVMLGGAFDYDDFGASSNGRAVLRSTDAGTSFRDMSSDAQNDCDPASVAPPAACPAGMHPDTHAVAFVPDQTGVFFVGSDGGVSRSGLGVVPSTMPPERYVGASSDCNDRGLTGSDLTVCQNLLGSPGIPYRTDFLNSGLDTLQFQSVSVNPQNPTGDVLAGAQDNGTWAQRPGGGFFESIGGDGGQSLIDPRVGDPGRAARVHTFFDASMDVNYGSSDPPGTANDWAYDPALGTSNPDTWLYMSEPMDDSTEAFSFYVPLIDDPATPGTLFTAGQHVWRTTDMGGPRAFLDANCQDSSYVQPTSTHCGDWATLGAGTGTDLSGGDAENYVVALARAPSDAGTLWAATRKGDLWLSTDANASDPRAVTWAKLSSSRLPSRFVSSILVDPADARHAWISYSGYAAYTPSTPGHVFDVRVDGAGNVAVTDLSGTGADGIGDLPVTALVRDDPTGDLYAATDFGVLRLPSGATAWAKAAAGMPIVGVYGLTAVPGSRLLYAATHGRGLWTLTLPAAPVTPQPPPAGTPPNTSTSPTTTTPAPTSGGTHKPRFRSARVQRLGRRLLARIVLRDAGGTVRVVVRDRLGRRVASRTVIVRSGRPTTITVKLPRGASTTLNVTLTASNAKGSSTAKRGVRPPRRVTTPAHP